MKYAYIIGRLNPKATLILEVTEQDRQKLRGIVLQSFRFMGYRENQNYVFTQHLWKWELYDTKDELFVEHFVDFL